MIGGEEEWADNCYCSAGSRTWAALLPLRGPRTELDLETDGHLSGWCPVRGATPPTGLTGPALAAGAAGASCRPRGVGLFRIVDPAFRVSAVLWRGEPATVAVRRAGAGMHASAELTEPGT